MRYVSRSCSFSGWNFLCNCGLAKKLVKIVLVMVKEMIATVKTAGVIVVVVVRLIEMVVWMILLVVVVI